MKVNIHLFHRALGIVALAFGTLLLSCTQEIPVDYPDNDGVEMVINVGNDTRTSNNGDQTLWDADDVLTVIHTSDGTEFWASAFQNTGGNAFTGKVKRLSATNDWYVIYPYLEENVAANQISFTFPSSQTQTANGSMGHLAGDAFPLYGKKTGVARTEALNMPMQNLLAVAGFKVKNDLKDSDRSIIVKEVQFTAPVQVSGSFSVDLTGDAPVFTAGSGATKTVKLTVEEGSEIEKGAESWFYVAVAPFEAPVGSKIQLKTVAVYADDPTTQVVFYRTIDVEQATSFNSGVIKTVNVPFDEKNSTNPDAGTGTEVELEEGEEPEDGVYLLVYKNGETSMAFAAFDEYKSQNYAIPVTVVDNQVLPQEDIDLSRFEITIEKAGLVHPNDAGHDAYNVKNSEGKFIFYASGGSGDAILRIQDTNTLSNSSSGNVVSYYHTFVQAEDGVQILSSGSESGYNKYLLAYSAANGFYYEQNNTGQKLHLYLLGGSAKEHQELTFSADNVTYNFDTNGEGPLTNAPTLSGDMTPVTWSSNNVSVATVDNSGHVTIHGVGIAVITAKAEADQTYYSDSASYTIEVTSSSMQTWYKAEEMEDGKQYLIVSNGYALQNNNGSVAATAVTVSNETITLNAPSGLLWTANSSKQLTNNNQSLGSSNSSSGYGWGSASLAIGSNAATWTYDAESNLLTTSISSQWSATTYYLYYSNSSNAFTINSSASDTHIATLYSTTKPAVKQVLSFGTSTVRWIIGGGDGYAIDGTYDVLTVKGASTQVTYTSSNPEVAEIVNNTQIRVKSIGYTTITATAPAGTVSGIDFNAGTASYTLYIQEIVSGPFESLGSFNLENDAVSEYLDAVVTEYNEDNITSTSILKTYYNKYSSNRLDIPKPVTIEWNDVCSGTATITILDEDKSTVVWTQTAASGSTSCKVYNLIPGKTYYCTVKDSSRELLKGEFKTSGRRRMMKVSDNTSSNSFAGNCRDLGGLKTTNGKRIKYGYIYRGTNLDGLSADERAFMLNFMNIGLDNELREGTRENRLGVRFVNPGYSGTNDLQDKSKFKRTMQAFIDVAIIDHKASYFHCAIGADRTGYTGFMLEALLGVSANDCSIDYEMTSFANPIIGGDRLRNGGGMLYYFGEARDFINGLNYSSALSLQGKVIKYVNEVLGISMDDINAFLEEVLEDDPDL